MMQEVTNTYYALAMEKRDGSMYLMDWVPYDDRIEFQYAQYQPQHVDKTELLELLEILSDVIDRKTRSIGSETRYTLHPNINPADIESVYIIKVTQTILYTYQEEDEGYEWPCVTDTPPSSTDPHHVLPE